MKRMIEYVHSQRESPSVSFVVNTSGKNIYSIERLFHSIAKQTYNKFEVVVATESNGKRISELALNVFGNAVPIRIVETRLWNRCKTANVGIKLSRGEFVALLEDDLVLDHEWLHMLMDRFARSSANVACCYGSCITVSGSESLSLKYKKLSRFIKIVRILTIHNSLLRRVKEPIVFNLCVLCKKKALLKAGLFDRFVEEPILGEDYDLAMRLVSKGYRIIYEPKAKSLHYTEHVGKRALMVRENPRILEKLVQSEVYLLTKNRNLLGFNLLPHVAYRSTFEGINMALRTRTLEPLFYALSGAIKGFTKGVMTSPDLRKN